MIFCIVRVGITKLFMSKLFKYFGSGFYILIFLSSFHTENAEPISTIFFYAWLIFFPCLTNISTHITKFPSTPKLLMIISILS